jgi:DNA-binding transcriptional ArsR family regulator
MDITRVVSLGAAISDGTRLQVLELCDGRLAVGEIAAALNLTSATISHHLAVLERGGLVEVHRRGRRSVPLRVPGVGRRLVAALG